MTPGYRPQLLWLVMGPLLGVFAGAVVATVLVWGTLLLGSTPTGPGDLGVGIVVGLVLGAIFGGLVGGAVGLVVGVPMAFLVGRHLPREVAVRRASVLGAVLPPATLLLGPAILLDAWPSASDASTASLEDAVALLPLLGAALLGSRLAAWQAGRGDAARTVS